MAPDAAWTVPVPGYARYKPMERLDLPFEVTVGGECATEDDVAVWEAAGVDRLIVSPWRRTAEALDAMAAFAARFIRA